jgi:hypothetical protein
MSEPSISVRLVVEAAKKWAAGRGADTNDARELLDALAALAAEGT